jgi:hypothetical protein
MSDIDGKSRSAVSSAASGQVPKSESARIVVIVQMLGDLAVLGADVRVLLGAIRYLTRRG